MNYTIDWGDVPGWLQFLGVTVTLGIMVWIHLRTLAENRASERRANEEFVAMVENVAAEARRAIPIEVPDTGFGVRMRATLLKGGAAEMAERLVQTPLIHWPAPAMYADASALSVSLQAAVKTLEQVGDHTADMRIWDDGAPFWPAGAYDSPTDAWESARRGVVENAAFLADQCSITRTRLGLPEPVRVPEESWRTVRVLRELQANGYV